MDSLLVKEGYIEKFSDQLLGLLASKQQVMGKKIKSISEVVTLIHENRYKKWWGHWDKTKNDEYDWLRLGWYLVYFWKFQEQNKIKYVYLEMYFSLKLQTMEKFSIMKALIFKDGIELVEG